MIFNVSEKNSIFIRSIFSEAVQKLLQILLVETTDHLGPLAQLVSASAHEAKLFYVHVRVPAESFFLCQMQFLFFLLIILGITYFAIWSYWLLENIANTLVRLSIASKYINSSTSPLLLVEA